MDQKLKFKYKHVCALDPTRTIIQHVDTGCQLFCQSIEPEDISRLAIYQTLQGPGVATLLDYGKHNDKYFIITDLKGPSLCDLTIWKRSFALVTVFQIAIQLLTLVERLHDLGYIHGNIHPDHFLVGFGLLDTYFFIAGFKSIKEYTNAYTTDNRPPHPFDSEYKHKDETSPRADLVSLGYVLLYALYGGLPWGTENPETWSPNMEEMKTNFRPKLNPFSSYFYHVRILNREDKPDYAHLRGLFEASLKYYGWQHDRLWEVFELRKIVKNPNYPFFSQDFDPKSFEGAVVLYPQIHL